MFALTESRMLRKLQKRRAKYEREARAEMKGVSGAARIDLESRWDHEFATIQEEIDELLSDRIRRKAERYDVALPKFDEEGDHWERLHIVGERHILTRLGREVTRAKIVAERRYAREVWSFIISLGGLIVAGMAIYFRK